MIESEFDVTTINGIEELVDEQISHAFMSPDMQRRQASAMVAIALELRALRHTIAGKPSTQSDNVSVVDRLIEVQRETTEYLVTNLRSPDVYR